MVKIILSEFDENTTELKELVVNKVEFATLGEHRGELLVEYNDEWLTIPTDDVMAII